MMASFDAPAPKMTRQEIQALSHISAEMDKFLKNNGVPSLGDFNDIAAGRKATQEVVQRTRSKLGTPEPSIEELEMSVPTRDGWLSRSIVCRPSLDAKKCPGPLIVLFHGGGFITGAPDTFIIYARAFVQLFDAVVVCPTYRLAPEHKFPVGFNDAWDIVQHLAKTAADLRADPSNGFIIGGGSAGGNFTPVLARRAIESGLVPKVTGQWLSFPVFFEHSGETVPEKYRQLWTSWEQNRDAIIINSKDASALFSLYEPDFKSPLFNPLVQEPPFELNKMPKAFVQVAGMDLVRDDGIVYAYALEDAGVEVRLKAYAGVPHSFWAFTQGLEESRTALIDIRVGMGWLLGRGIQREDAKDTMRL